MPSTYLELIAKGLLVEKDPRVPIPPIPMGLELAHALQNALQLLIAHQADKRSAGTGREDARELAV